MKSKERVLRWIISDTDPANLVLHVTQKAGFGRSPRQTIKHLIVFRPPTSLRAGPTCGRIDARDFVKETMS